MWLLWHAFKRPRDHYTFGDVYYEEGYEPKLDEMGKIEMFYDKIYGIIGIIILFGVPIVVYMNIQ